MSVRTFQDARSIHPAAGPAGDREDSSTSDDEAESLVAFATLDEHELEFLRFISSDPAYRGPHVPGSEEIAQFRRRHDEKVEFWHA